MKDEPVEISDTDDAQVEISDTDDAQVEETPQWVVSKRTNLVNLSRMCLSELGKRIPDHCREFTECVLLNESALNRTTEQYFYGIVENYLGELQICCKDFCNKLQSETHVTTLFEGHVKMFLEKFLETMNACNKNEELEFKKCLQEWKHLKDNFPIAGRVQGEYFSGL